MLALLSILASDVVGNSSMYVVSSLVILVTLYWNSPSVNVTTWIFPVFLVMHTFPTSSISRRYDIDVTFQRFA